MKAVIEKVTPLMEAKDYDKALTEAQAVMKAHPDMKEDEKVQILLGISLAPSWRSAMPRLQTSARQDRRGIPEQRHRQADPRSRRASRTPFR